MTWQKPHAPRCAELWRDFRCDPVVFPHDTQTLVLLFANEEFLQTYRADAIEFCRRHKRQICRELRVNPNNIRALCSITDEQGGKELEQCPPRY